MDSGPDLIIRRAANGFIVQEQQRGDRMPDPFVFTDPVALADYVGRWAAGEQTDPRVEERARARFERARARILANSY